jgi:hypothetical protein
MKATLSRFGFAVLAALVPIARAADQAPPPPRPEMREARTIAGRDGEAPRPGARIGGRAFAGRVDGEKEVVTFLGVEAGPVSPTLTAQLGLAEGTGLVVIRLVPDSPATSALKEHDILLKLDDQILIDQHQLSILIRNHKEGDEVAITYVRAGKQAVARVKLAKHEMPKMAVFEQPFLPGGGGLTLAAGPAGAPFPPVPGARIEADRMLSMVNQPPGGPAQIRIERGNGPGIRATRVNTADSNLVYTDDKGSLSLTIKDGAKTLVAKDARGEEVFSGPVTTDEERRAMPADVRQRLEQLEGMHDVTFRTDGNFQGTEVKVVRPPGRSISLPLPPPTPVPLRRPVSY